MSVLLQLLSPMILSDALAGGSSSWVSFLLGGSFQVGGVCITSLSCLLFSITK